VRSLSYFGGNVIEQIFISMHQRNLFEEIWHQLKSGEMTQRLLIINIFIFCFIQGLFAFSRLFPTFNFIDNFVKEILEMNNNFSKFIIHPWTILTSIFTHFLIWHVASNMIFLFFAGSHFEKIFGATKLLATYLLGGLLGNLFELLAHFLAPDVIGGHPIVGASGAIMAIVAAIAFYRPQTPVYLFGIVNIPIYIFAIFFFVKDLIGIGEKDQIAHFAHLGGAFFGFLAVQNIHSQSNMLNRITRLFERKQGTAPRKNARFKTDEVFNAEKIAKQERIDEILDKISKSGYESLSREEKDYLFNQGQK